MSVDVEIEGCVHVEEGAAGSCAVGWQLLHLNLPPPVHLPPLLLLVVNIGKSFNKREVTLRNRAYIDSSLKGPM